MDLTDFYSSFWSDFLAGLVLLLIGTFLIPKYLSWRNRPKLIMLNRSTHKAQWEFGKAKNGQWTSYARLLISNRGNKTVERFYWEMYVKSGINLELQVSITGDPKYGIFYSDNYGDYRRFYGYIEKPIFQLESIDFNYALYSTSEERVPVEIYYYFKTDQGQYPFLAWAGVSFKKFFLLKKLKII